MADDSFGSNKAYLLIVMCDSFSADVLFILLHIELLEMYIVMHSKVKITVVYKMKVENSTNADTIFILGTNPLNFVCSDYQEKFYFGKR